MAPLARAVLLDLDGTLLDTAPDLIGSLNDLRAEQHLAPLPAGQLATVVSHGSGPLVRRGFDIDPSDTRFAGLRKRFLAIYRERVHRETRAFAGMDELLAVLEARHVPWGIVTNKPGWLTRPLVAALGYSERSGCLITGDDLALRKPNPYPVLQACDALNLPPEACVVVGDAQRDVESGQRAGAITLVALFGYVHAEDRVTHWGADGLIGHPLDILNWLEPA
ncbi:N-acetylmuramic acid 6-phosphate phosphatase [wastewater metagenome]|uniref:N-acetylmuramic acid 6-phosphate phosphatase n=2 Tax=unclassified sequences TaxID=12908 RepID=A0A5B8R924_9ZZZZ|nr:HAD-IA family hydrolase [Arhodomonas aquaeolei]MCS4505028.1 HAD-IA family hydrolase [Arhodomonas aquaeolei]QEA05256.1 N-acetylmuramic acid 6-phosphate phosphatase [uncultured organism]